MEYNINFWHPPNWQRESSINPKFVMVVIISIFLILSFSLYSIIENQRNSSAKELAILQEQVEQLKPQVEHLEHLKRETDRWTGMLNKLNEKSKHRIFWSRQLEALQQLTPDSITLGNLNVRNEILRIETPVPRTGQGPPPPPKIEYKTVYHLHIDAIAHGQNINQEIADFAESIGHSKIIGEKLQGYEIRNISEYSGPDRELYPEAQSFVLNCTYKPLPEIF